MKRSAWNCGHDARAVIIWYLDKTLCRIPPRHSKYASSRLIYISHGFFYTLTRYFERLTGPPLIKRDTITYKCMEFRWNEALFAGPLSNTYPRISGGVWIIRDPVEQCNNIFDRPSGTIICGER